MASPFTACLNSPVIWFKGKSGTLKIHNSIDKPANAVHQEIQSGMNLSGSVSWKVTTESSESSELRGSAFQAQENPVQSS